MYTQEEQKTLTDFYKEVEPRPKHRWIYRNDQPAHEAEAHAYESDNDVCLCGKHNRSKFDWTEMDGERCIECQNIIGE